MIIGIGVDILKLERLIATYERTGGRLAQRILGDDELLVFHARLQRNHARGMAYLATRFAAKEAFSKAIGLGMHTPMTWRSMQTLNDSSGKPVVHCSGALQEWMSKQGYGALISVSDEVDYVVAYAVVSKIN